MTPKTSTGFSPKELVAPEAARLLPLNRKLEHVDFAIPHAKAHYRTALLRRVHAISRLANDLEESQLRYKLAHDAHVRERNADIQEGDWLFVNREVMEKGVSPKLSIPVEGPLEVVKVHSHTHMIHTANGIVSVPSDRATRAPYPTDLRTPLPSFSRARESQRDAEDDEIQEFVVECIISYGMLDDGQPIVRVR
jgi:hypothetical protein